MPEMTTNFSHGKIKIESDSNSIKHVLLAAYVAIEEAIERLEDLNIDTLSEEDQEIHARVSEDLVDVVEKLDVLDSFIENGPPSDLKFLYEDLP